MKPAGVSLVTLACVCFLLGAPAAFCLGGVLSIAWVNPAGGSWNDPANWQFLNVPDQFDEAAELPPLAGSPGSPYDVVLDMSPRVYGLWIGAGAARLDLNGMALALGSGGVVNGGQIDAHGACVISGDMTNLGIVNIPGGAALTLTDGAVTNHGPVRVNSDAVDADAVLTFATNTVLWGSGEVILNGAGSRAQLEIAPGAVLTNAAGHTIRGRGQVNGSLINEGSILADMPGSALQFQPGGTGLINFGAIRAVGGGGVTISSSWLFVNQADVLVDVGSRLSAGGSGYTQTAGGTIVDGLLAATGGPVSILGGRLSGRGDILGDLQVGPGGILSPGGSPGTLFIHGDCAAEGLTELEIAGYAPGVEHDVMAVDGSCALGGTLNIARAPSFVPVPGDRFGVIGYAWRTGEFDTVNGRSIGGGLFFDLDYQPAGLALVVRQTLLGDTEFDLDVDFSDYQTLEANFGATGRATWEQGDFDGDGDVDFADYQALEANYGHGVPAPAALALLAAGAAPALRRRRGA